MMSKKQNNQDEENVNTEQGDSMNGEKDQENLENSQEGSRRFKIMFKKVQ